MNWVFTGISVIGRRLYILQLGERNRPRDLLIDAGLAVFPHYGVSVVHYWTLLANASTSR